MPSYLLSGNIKNSNTTGCCCDSSIDSNSAIFFNNLASKILDMSKAIEKKMDDLSKQVCTQAIGFSLVQINTPSMLLGVKYEYMEYIKRYGPPDGGQFDEVLLEKIRNDLGVKNEVI
jgi:hypothetical protein